MPITIKTIPRIISRGPTQGRKGEVSLISIAKPHPIRPIPTAANTPNIVEGILTFIRCPQTEIWGYPTTIGGHRDSPNVTRASTLTEQNPCNSSVDILPLCTIVVPNRYRKL
jgi:hypothetical protein